MMMRKMFDVFLFLAVVLVVDGAVAVLMRQVAMRVLYQSAVAVLLRKGDCV